MQFIFEDETLGRRLIGRKTISGNKTPGGGNPVLMDKLPNLIGNTMLCEYKLYKFTKISQK
jgi:hypothetical protein